MKIINNKGGIIFDPSKNNERTSMNPCFVTTTQATLPASGFPVQLKVLFITYKALYGIGPGYPRDKPLIVSAHPISSSRVSVLQISSIQCCYLENGGSVLELSRVPESFENLAFIPNQWLMFIICSMVPVLFYSFCCLSDYFIYHV